MAGRCDNCGGRVGWWGRRTRDGDFCSPECESYFDYPGFCRRCREETEPTSSGSVATLNGVGTRLLGGRGRCRVCDSVVQTKYFCFGFPLVPLGRYRVRYVTPTEYLSRRLRDRPRR